MTRVREVQARRKRLLVLGPLPRVGTAIGGTQVSFAHLIEHLLRSRRFELDVCDTTRAPARSRLGRAWSELRGFVSAVIAVARRGARADVILFNASSGGVLRAGPWLTLVARAVGRPLAVRVFGGKLDLELARASSRRRRMALRTWIRAPLLVVQTRALASWCATIASTTSVRRLPTTRDMPARESPVASRATKFVFMAQLRPEKGLADALRASDELPDGASLDVYGPAMPGTDMGLFERHPRASYRGVARPSDVASILEEHDVLVFPSTYEGEGLPGVVIEALQLGLPVIATEWRALPELVVHERTGLLVAPHDAPALAAALTRIARDARLFRTLSRGAREHGATYRGADWLPRFEDWLSALCAEPAARADSAARSELERDTTHASGMTSRDPARRKRPRSLVRGAHTHTHTHTPTPTQEESLR